MTGKGFPFIVLGAIIVAAGMLIAWATARRYRRELGLKQKEQDKTQNVSFIIGAFQDVTRQLKEKEKELERLRALAESRAENILQCVSNGVIAFDEKGRVNAVNRAAEELLGMRGEAMAGHSCSEIFDNSEICRFVHEALKEHVTSRRMEASLFRNGEHVWLGFNTALLTDRQGNSLGAILSFSDLTEVKRLQEQVELKERLTALGEMSAGIAHELRNPMAVIIGYLSLLSRDQSEADKSIIRDITAEINGMNRIIGDLLTFARPASLNRAECPLKELLESTVESVLQNPREGREITTRMAIVDLSVMADDGLLRQALQNIVQNAVDAMPSGGMLTITTGGHRDVSIAVQDTGSGIAPENLKKVFLPFFTTREQGVGMGLALAHKIITAHGGRIEVESVVEKGSTFIITLPRN